MAKQRSALEAQKPKKESTRTRALLKWGPLMLSGLLVLGGGAALGISTLGHEEDRATVARLVEEREAKADAAEQSLEDALEALLADASPYDPARLSADAEAGEALLSETEQLSSFEAVLASSLGATRTYAATFETEDGRHGLLTYTTSKDGAISDDSVVWADGAPAESDPAE